VEQQFGIFAVYAWRYVNNLEPRAVSLQQLSLFLLNSTIDAFLIEYIWLPNWRHRHICIVLENVAIAIASNLRPSDVASIVLGCFGQFWPNCYFAASGQNSDIYIRFSNPDFLKESNNVEIICDLMWCRDLDLWHLTLTFVVDRVSCIQTLVLDLSEMRQFAAKLLTI